LLYPFEQALASPITAYAVFVIAKIDTVASSITTTDSNFLISLTVSVTKALL
jgi:hypothetical protein